MVSVSLLYMRLKSPMPDVVNANQFLEELENTHIVLFHDGNNETKKQNVILSKRTRKWTTLLLHNSNPPENLR